MFYRHTPPLKFQGVNRQSLSKSRFLITYSTVSEIGLEIKQVEQ